MVTNGVVSRDFGFARGFDVFEYLAEDRATREVHRSSRDANAAVRAILAARPADRPLFLWVHTTDPHAPYQPAPEWLAQVGGEGTGLEAGSMERTFGSTCHGAGRAMSRTAAKMQATGRKIEKELEHRGVIAMATSRMGLAEEQPAAYKNVDHVVDVVHEANLSRKVARMRPVGVIKG